jgi:hypothetical protein
MTEHEAKVRERQKRVRDRRRAKVLELLPRGTLEDAVDGSRRPHMWTRKELVNHIVLNWDDDIEREALEWIGLIRE